ncbi:MAG: GntR family transcriptional regulator [Acidimicrobiales bacterium]
MTETASPEAPRASEVVYRTVRREITTGRRPGGSWLREGEIADELGVSRTPVREALRRLSAEGLVRHEPNRGVRVETWSAVDLDEIFGLRALLEPEACSLATRSGRLDLGELRRLASAMDEAVAGPEPDLDALTDLNNAFHHRIYQGSGNARLAAQITTLIDVTVVQRTFAHYSERSLRRSLAHHHELVDAFEAGDPEWAAAVMTSHVHAAWSTVPGRPAAAGPPAPSRAIRSTSHQEP